MKPRNGVTRLFTLQKSEPYRDAPKLNHLLHTNESWLSVLGCVVEVDIKYMGVFATGPRDAFFLAAMCSGAMADTITIGPGLGTSDYTTITAEIANATNGDEIVISPGLYAENLIIFDKVIALRTAGGGTVTESERDIDRCLNTSGLNTDVVLDGITFSHGFTAGVGAGMAIYGGAHGTIIGCIIEDLHAQDSGGGMYISGGVTMSNPIVRNNVSSNKGGGIWISDQHVFRALNCVLELNSARSLGGVVRNEQIFDAVNCTFVNNFVETSSTLGTFYAPQSYADTNLLNCVVVNEGAASFAGPGDSNVFLR